MALNPPFPGSLAAAGRISPIAGAPRNTGLYGGYAGRQSPSPVGVRPLGLQGVTGVLGRPPAIAQPNQGALSEKPDRSSNTFATDTLARITRERYADYMRRFRDIENEQIAYATDRTKPLTEAQSAMESVQGSFNRIPGQQQRRDARLGLDAAAPDVTASLNRSTAIAGGLATVTAANRAAQQTYDRQGAIFSGATGQSIPKIGA